MTIIKKTYRKQIELLNNFSIFFLVFCIRLYFYRGNKGVNEKQRKRFTPDKVYGNSSQKQCIACTGILAMAENLYLSGVVSGGKHRETRKSMILRKAENLTVKQYQTREEMGKAAARDVSQKIQALLKEQDTVRMIFAAAPSQNEFLEALTADTDIDFSRIVAFHMDEYIGLPEDAPQGFANFLRERLFYKRKFHLVNTINGLAQDTRAECRRYAALLAQAPIDIVCMGIGENGHIAFNDPAYADFHDTQLVKTVLLDDVCRQQQVNDGCFSQISQVPLHAITLTIPALTCARGNYCIVPAKTKSKAVYRAIYGEVSESLPASILRNIKNSFLYLDQDSASLLPEIKK